MLRCWRSQGGMRNNRNGQAALQEMVREGWGAWPTDAPVRQTGNHSKTKLLYLDLPLLDYTENNQL